MNRSSTRAPERAVGNIGVGVRRQRSHAGVPVRPARRTAPRARRTPLDELVVAPYATALARCSIRMPPPRTCKRLERMGARGEMGFVEALDFTPDGRPAASTHAVVDTFMAHHQGMTIIALCNALHDGSRADGE